MTLPIFYLCNVINAYRIIGSVIFYGRNASTSNPDERKNLSRCCQLSRNMLRKHVRKTTGDMIILFVIRYVSFAHFAIDRCPFYSRGSFQYLCLLIYDSRIALLLCWSLSVTPFILSNILILVDICRFFLCLGSLMYN